MIEKYNHSGSFHLERGGVLEQVEIAYSTYGCLNAAKDNVVWVCHALTANSEVDDWWPNTVEKDRFLDPDKWFVVCANILGSHYGTTGPLSTIPYPGNKPKKGAKTPEETDSSRYYGDFPAVTIRDMVNAHVLLADQLGIERIHRLIGSSVGGFQALEWAILQPERIENLVLIATDSHIRPWGAALNETQRMAIKADATYGEASPEAGRAGLATARAIGLLSYRGPSGYNASQQNSSKQPHFSHRVSTYQSYQGEKLCNRFNAYSYMTILDAFDSHDVGRNRNGIEEALKRVAADTICIGITTDILFPPSVMKELAGRIPRARYKEISSEFGHDGFLVEHEQLNKILTDI